MKLWPPYHGCQELDSIRKIHKFNNILCIIYCVLCVTYCITASARDFQGRRTPPNLPGLRTRMAHIPDSPQPHRVQGLRTVVVQMDALQPRKSQGGCGGGRESLNLTTKLEEYSGGILHYKISSTEKARTSQAHCSVVQ